MGTINEANSGAEDWDQGNLLSQLMPSKLRHHPLALRTSYYHLNNNLLKYIGKIVQLQITRSLIPKQGSNLTDQLTEALRISLLGAKLGHFLLH